MTYKSVAARLGPSGALLASGRVIKTSDENATATVYRVEEESER